MSHGESSLAWPVLCTMCTGPKDLESGTDVVYIYDGWHVVEEKDNVSGGWNTRRQFVYGTRYIDEVLIFDNDTDGDGNCAEAGDDTRYLYCQDANYNVMALTDIHGAPVERYIYDPYGVCTVTLDNASGNPYRFQGRRYDTETGLYYFRNRYYHPTLGRFLQRDPLGYAGGRNLYELAPGNPTKTGDPSGMKWVLRDQRGEDPKSVFRHKAQVKRLNWKGQEWRHAKYWRGNAFHGHMKSFGRWENWINVKALGVSEILASYRVIGRDRKITRKWLPMKKAVAEVWDIWVCDPDTGRFYPETSPEVIAGEKGQDGPALAAVSTKVTWWYDNPKVSRIHIETRVTVGASVNRSETWTDTSSVGVEIVAGVKIGGSTSSGWSVSWKDGPGWTHPAKSTWCCEPE